MTPHWADESVTVFHGDCLDVMRELDACSVDAVCTDPPYNLSFMAKAWDAHESPAEFQSWCEQWAAECLRVLKPGGHMLAFGGTRTWHRLACAVEDAGFEVRDNIAYLGTSLVWVYGAGFPKSHNVNKALAGRICECEAVPYRYDKVSREGVSDLREDMAADDALPVDAEQDLLTEVRGTIDESEQDGHPVADEVAAPDLPGMRDHVSPVADEATGTTTASLLTPVQGETRRRPDGDDRGEGPHRVDHSGSSGILEEDEWPEQSGVEGRGNPQTTEGELHGGSVRPVPAGVSSDGTQGRLHHGAPSSDGSVDRSPVVEGRSGKPQGPQPVEQRPGEPRALADERRPQAWRGWPVCFRCGKPEVPSGLGTALKPAHEPVVVARKPLVGTVAANVLAHGTGALNVDGCRIPTDGEQVWTHRAGNGSVVGLGSEGAMPRYESGDAEKGDRGGRWPANVILDESQAAALDEQSGTLTSGKPGSSIRGARSEASVCYADMAAGSPLTGFGDSGGASRFFYVAKADTNQRPRTDDTAHPTVKPLDLMRWLVRLITPPNGLVLDPFAGSGTTAEACIIEGFHCVTIEREQDYLPLIVQRLTKPIEPVMF